MKVTVELSDSELNQVRRFTGEKKKGPAIRKILTEALRLKRRDQMLEKFVSGEWSVEFKGYEEAVKKEKEEAQKMYRLWREDGAAN